MLARVKDATGKDIGNRLEHLQAVAKQVGHIPELDYPEPTDDLQYLMQHFWKIKKQGQRISYSELAAYSQMTCSNLCAFEVDLLLEIDNIFEAQHYG